MGVGCSQPFEINGLKLLEKIGEGGYAKVYKAEWKGQVVAAKQLMEHIYFQDELKERFYDECETLRGLDHRNIVKMIDLLVPDGEIPPILITELLHCDLAAHIRRQTSRIPTPEVVNIMLDVAKGLRYLHNRPLPIAHRDLTSKNVLLTENGTAKIADLGLTKTFIAQAVASPNPGVLLYAAPETFCQQPVYDVKVDVFSFGVLLLEVINGHYPKPVPCKGPFTQDGDVVLELQRRERDISDMGAGHCLSGLVHQCLRNESEARPTAKRIVTILSRQKEKIKCKTRQPLSYRFQCSDHPRLKVFVVGNSKTGRTSIIRRHQNSLFHCDEVSCNITGENYYMTRVHYDGINYSLMLVDTVGVELVYRYGTRWDFRFADAVLFVFDISRRETFDEGVHDCIQLIGDSLKYEVSMILVGNKVDSPRREVSAEEAHALADKCTMWYIETSAKTGQNIEDLFERVVQMIVNRRYLHG